MRLSSRLSDKSKNHGEIESFIDWEKFTTSSDDATEEIHLISPGDFIEIQIGKITMPFYSQKCNDIALFVSPIMNPTARTRKFWLRLIRRSSRACSSDPKRN